MDSDEKELKAKCFTQAGPYLLPFSPNPHWRKSEVFIVGLNPISSLRDEFSSYDYYWGSLVKRPERYWRAYASKYSRSEEARSRTSSRINKLCERLRPLNVLVTNICAYPETNPKRIPVEFRKAPARERILTRLISICCPRVLFFHGREARGYVKELFGVDLNPYLPPAAQAYRALIPGSTEPSHLFAYHHLVGRVDDSDTVGERLEEFGNLIRERAFLT